MNITVTSFYLAVILTRKKVSMQDWVLPSLPSVRWSIPQDSLHSQSEIFKDILVQNMFNILCKFYKATLHFWGYELGKICHIFA
jgi:hypothetical protein